MFPATFINRHYLNKLNRKPVWMLLKGSLSIELVFIDWARAQNSKSWNHVQFDQIIRVKSKRTELNNCECQQYSPPICQVGTFSTFICSLKWREMVWWQGRKAHSKAVTCSCWCVCVCDGSVWSWHCWEQAVCIKDCKLLLWRVVLLFTVSDKRHV